VHDFANVLSKKKKKDVNATQMMKDCVALLTPYDTMEKLKMFGMKELEFTLVTECGWKKEDLKRNVLVEAIAGRIGQIKRKNKRTKREMEKEEEAAKKRKQKPQKKIQRKPTQKTYARRASERLSAKRKAAETKQTSKRTRRS